MMEKKLEGIREQGREVKEEVEGMRKDLREQEKR